MAYRVLIYEDNHRLRQSLEILLNDEQLFKVAGAFPDCNLAGEQVIELLAELEVMGAGADGYLLKNTSPMQLITALQEVMQGGAPMSPFVAQKVFQFFRNQQQPVSDFNLTNRETMILELLVKGNSYKMIADKSNVTIDTVKKHLQNIYHKLHVNCGTEAVAKALQHKIIRLD